MSLGGAGRAAVEDGEQFIHNPATVTQSSVLSSSMIYYDGYNGEGEHDNLYGFTLTDNSDELLMSGGYVYAHQARSFLNQNDIKEEYHQASVGWVVRKHFALGVSFTYLSSLIETVGKYEQINGHIGAFYNPLPTLAFGFVAYNVGGRAARIPVAIEEGNKLGFGVLWVADPLLRVRFDVAQMQVRNPEHKNEYMAGFESKTSEFFVIRAGLQADDLADRRYWSLGLSFDGPRAKIDYFYRKNFEFGEAALHGVDIRVPFW
jgi:hypothetical protein